LCSGKAKKRKTQSSSIIGITCNRKGIGRRGSSHVPTGDKLRGCSLKEKPKGKGKTSKFTYSLQEFQEGGVGEFCYESAQKPRSAWTRQIKNLYENLANLVAKENAPAQDSGGKKGKKTLSHSLGKKPSEEGDDRKNFGS